MPAQRLRRMGGVTPRRSRAWDLTFRAAYALIRLTDPLLRWTWFSVGLGITSRLTVRGRRTGRDRSVLVGLIRVNRTWYVGHPNGEVAWTANLRARRTKSAHRAAAGGADRRQRRAAVDRGGARRRHPRHGRTAAIPGQPPLSGSAPTHPERGPLLPP